MIITKEMLLVTHHDTSLTGLRYKLIVKLGKTPKYKGQTVLDIGNNLYKAIGFTYTYNPEYQGRGKSTILVYYFNDVEYANKLNQWLTDEFLESESLQKNYKAHELDFHKKGYPAFIRPYCNGN